MPIYEYQCVKCHHHLEALQKMADKPLRECPECGKHSLKRLVSAPMFRLAGSGWYETDFKSDQETKRNLAGKDEAPAAEAAAPAKTDKPDKPDKPDRKVEKKPRPRRPRDAPRPASRRPGRSPSPSPPRASRRRRKPPAGAETRRVAPALE